MPRGSFLNRPVHSTTGLVRQYDNDRQVRGRFVKALRRSPAEVHAILANLKIKRLTASHVYLVGFYHRDGNWGFHSLHVRRGALAFITPSGQPFLLVVCGNPVETVRFARRLGENTPPVVSIPEELEAPPIAYFNAEALLAPLISPEAPGIVSASEIEIPDLVPPIESPLPDLQMHLSPVVPPLIGSAPFNWNWLLLGVPVAALIHGGSESGGPPTVPIVTPPGGGTVPEINPAATLLIGLAVAGAGMYGRRRKTSR